MTRIALIPGDGCAALPWAEIVLRPGWNTGTHDQPCPECKSTTDQHRDWCRHFFFQRQWEG